MKTRHAVILAAGEGKRLRPLTDVAPKCMVDVCGQSILENAIILFASQGVKVVRIVIGHLASVVRERLGKSFCGVDIEYIENPDYAVTNSMYSLCLGLRGWQEDVWILEGDVFFEKAILSRPVGLGVSWFADGSRKDLDGAYLKFAPDQRALSLEIIRDVRLLSDGYAKSIGLLHVTSKSLKNIQSWLEKGVLNGQQNLYYDLVIGPHFYEEDVKVVDVGGLKWFEIDNLVDLENARKLFGCAGNQSF